MFNQKNSLGFGRIYGIPILIHWTFSLFIAFILYVAWQNNFNLQDTFWFLIFVFILFGFVILHELGHALAANRYGVKTRDIIISPIGGIARLEELPKKPVQELIVALAGPAVNLILALIFLSVLLPFTTHLFPETPRINLFYAPVDYIRYLFLINISLVVFNMIPAFPMDGGRVLRSILSMKFDKVKATYIAATLAKILAVGFMILGIYYSHLILAIIGGFVFFTSGTEYVNVLIDKILSETTAREALNQHAVSLSPEMKFNELKASRSENQNSFLVVDELNKPIGSIPHSFIKYIEKKKYGDRLVSEYMSQNFGAVHETISLKSVFALMNRNAWSIVSVLSKNHCSIGIIDRKGLEKYVFLKRKKTKN